MEPEIVSQMFAWNGIPTDLACLAYVGPGVGLGAIGAFFALVFAVLVAIVGFIWYPIRRLLRRRKSRQDNGDATTE